jgi:branched-chain amino acid transport system ATP-binding protein
MQPVLEVTNLTKAFGGLIAIDNVNLDIRKNEIVALIGPNGAGKTTFFNCVTGIYKPTKGEVKINPPEGSSRVLNGLKPNLVTEAGLARTFQNIRLFSKMTVLENVLVGTHCRTKSGIVSSIVKTPGFKKEERESVEYCYHLLEKVGLADKANEFSNSLPYADQRRLEIARALATKPFLLLLDEPAAGMNPQETLELDELIKSISRNDDVSILLIEHDMKLVMNISDRIFVMEYGRRIAHGTPEEIKEDPNVIKAYLGEDHDA